MDIRSSKGVLNTGPSFKFTGHSNTVLYRGGAQIPTDHLVQ
jgi:hypothetical protein